MSQDTVKTEQTTFFENGLGSFLVEEQHFTQNNRYFERLGFSAALDTNKTTVTNFSDLVDSHTQQHEELISTCRGMYGHKKQEFDNHVSELELENKLSLEKIEAFNVGLKDLEIESESTKEEIIKCRQALSDLSKSFGQEKKELLINRIDKLFEDAEKIEQKINDFIQNKFNANQKQFDKDKLALKIKVALNII